jgi:hypothetical protein
VTVLLENRPHWTGYWPDGEEREGTKPFRARIGMIRSLAYQSIDERGTKVVTPQTAIEGLNAIDLAGILN